jgi:hypothetical protein
LIAPAHYFFLTSSGSFATLAGSSIAVKKHHHHQKHDCTAERPNEQDLLQQQLVVPSPQVHYLRERFDEAVMAQLRGERCQHSSDRTNSM